MKDIVPFTFYKARKWKHFIWKNFCIYIYKVYFYLENGAFLEQRYNTYKNFRKRFR